MSLNTIWKSRVRANSNFAVSHVIVEWDDKSWNTVTDRFACKYIVWTEMLPNVRSMTEINVNYPRRCTECILRLEKWRAWHRLHQPSNWVSTK